MSRSRPLVGALPVPQGLGLAPVQLFRDGEMLSTADSVVDGDPLRTGDLRKTEIELIPDVPRGAGLVQDARGSEVAETDPAWQMSQLYAARGMGRQPGVPTQQER